MAKQHFLCTYSVKTREQDTPAEQKQAEANADKVRHDIRNYYGWSTISDIETTITGILEITGNTPKEKERKLKRSFEPKCAKL
ncbi:hypothetical protein [Vibrio sp. Hal054]|uniref:hypothetical protein n=1 Tax=Vibrio sp. Hal054 TaxID=3035158 RepID=UPI00301E0C03